MGNESVRYPLWVKFIIGWAVFVFLGILILALLTAFRGRARPLIVSLLPGAAPAGTDPVPTGTLLSDLPLATQVVKPSPTTAITLTPTSIRTLVPTNTPELSSTSTQSPTRTATLATPTSTLTPTKTNTPEPTPTEHKTPTQTPTSQHIPFLNQDLGILWNSIFDDEFNQPDLSKWNTCYWWDNNGCTNAGNRELEWYSPDQVAIKNDALILTADKQNVKGSDGKTYRYTSGMLTTGRIGQDTSTPVKFGFQYGLAEMRAIVPAGKGLWPAFWMLPANNNPYPDIDIMQVIGGSPKTVYMGLHNRLADGSKIDIGEPWNGPEDLSQDWHTYAVDWEPDHISWYVDGVERYQMTDTSRIPSVPMYLVIDLAVGGDGPGKPGDKTQFPNFFKIDYVRVWQRANTP